MVVLGQYVVESVALRHPGAAAALRVHGPARGRAVVHAQTVQPRLVDVVGAWEISGPTLLTTG